MKLVLYRSIIRFLVFTACLGGTSPNKWLYAEASVSDILEAIKQNSNRIESILFEYRIDYEDSSHPKGYYLNRTIAFKSPHFAYHSTSHGDAIVLAKDDPFLLFCLMNEEKCVVGRPNNGTFTQSVIGRNDPLVGTFPQEWGIWALGIWPLQSRPAHGCSTNTRMFIPNTQAKFLTILCTYEKRT